MPPLGLLERKCKLASQAHSLLPLTSNLPLTPPHHLFHPKPIPTICSIWAPSGTSTSSCIEFLTILQIPVKVALLQEVCLQTIPLVMRLQGNCLELIHQDPPLLSPSPPPGVWGRTETPKAAHSSVGAQLGGLSKALGDCSGHSAALGSDQCLSGLPCAKFSQDPKDSQRWTPDKQV